MRLRTLSLVILAMIFVIHPALTSPPSDVVLYDLRYSKQLEPKDAYETVQFVAALQGIVNREIPQLYILLTAADQQWFNHLRQTGEWMEDSNIKKVETIDELLTHFASYYNGVVLYDPNVPATSIIASTAAGVEDLLPVCKRLGENTLYTLYILNGPKLPIKRNLVDRFSKDKTGAPGIDSTESAKGNVHRWAKKTYLDTGRCDPTTLGYFIDYFWTQTGDRSINHTCSNHDYIIAKRGFFFDLNVWEDETTRDDRDQPKGTDLRVLQEILLSAYQQTKNDSMIHISGFTPWAYKYTTSGDAGGTHEPVPTEWQTAKVTSAYNAYLDADALGIGAMANASFYMHYPLKERYVQNPAPTKQQLTDRGYIDAEGKVVKKNYVMFYVGDYDSAAWVYSQLRARWDDDARGTVPMGWAINPNLSMRFPVIFPYLYETLRETDFIITGDSGAGYVNPTQLLEPRAYSGLPSAESLWQKHNIPFYRQFDLTITGFLINGLSGPITLDAEAMYLPFSHDGVVDQGGFAPNGVHLNENTPFFFHEDIPHNVDDAVNAILHFVKPDEMQFLVRRSILQSAGFHKGIVDKLKTDHADKNVEVVDPYTFCYLARFWMGGHNNDRVTYVNDTIPREMNAGRVYQVEIEIRNEGWNTLKHNSDKTNQNVLLKVHIGDEITLIELHKDLEQGQSISQSLTLTAPQHSGEYPLKYELEYVNGQSFSDLGTIAWESSILVK